MRLSVQNNLDQLATIQTYTATNLAAGGTTTPVKNINGFLNEYAIQYGKTGEEQAEIQTISGNPSGTTLATAGTLVYSHPLDTPIYQVHYDQIIFKRSTSGTAGTATALSNGTVNITPDSLETSFDDPTGATTYAYKTQYYNSVSGDTSAESDWFVPGGPSFYSLQSIRTRIKNKLLSANYIKDDAVIDDWINEYLEEMNTAAIKVNQDYLLGTTSVPYGTAGYGTITADDFMYANKIEIQTGTTQIPSTYLPVNRFAENDTFLASEPRHTWVGDTTFRILPSGNAGTALVTYAKGVTVLSNETDELPHPMRRYSRGFTYYGYSCALDLDMKEQQGAKEYAKAQKVKTDFINEIVPRDHTGPQFIDLAEGLSGYQEDPLFDYD